MRLLKYLNELLNCSNFDCKKFIIVFGLNYNNSYDFYFNKEKIRGYSGEMVIDFKR